MREKSPDCIRVFAVGDVIGRPGRQLMKDHFARLAKVFAWDALVVNVENSAGGFGLTEDVYGEFRRMGVDCMTSGNHIFDKQGYETWMNNAPLLVRPANWPPGQPGVGYRIIEMGQGVKLAVVNLIGRTFMKTYDCPFREAERLLPLMREQTPLILVDFHAEATSEKMSMGHFCAGKVSAVWGTHTHVPTADARIFAGHTGYITDLGMTGAYDSVIGMKKESVIRGFITLERTRFEVAKDDPRLGGCLFDLEVATGRCVQIQGVFLSEQELLEIQP